MSQFIIITGKEKPSIDIEGVSVMKLSEVQSLINEVSEFYEFPPEETWVICDSGSDTCTDLFSEASYQLSAGDKLSKCNLGIILGELVSKYDFVAWYGSEFEKLDQIDNPFNLYEHLEKELPVGAGEVYVEYHS